jgi:hypothetical protein
MGFDGERFTVGQKKLMKVPQLALDRSQCEASPGGTSQQISDRIVVDAKSTGASCVRVNKTVDPEMRVAEMIRQEQWLSRIPPPG